MAHIEGLGAEGTDKYHRRDPVDGTIRKIQRIGKAALALGALLVISGAGLAIIHFTAVPIFPTNPTLLAVTIPTTVGGFTLMAGGAFLIHRNRRRDTFSPERQMAKIRGEATRKEATLAEANTPAFRQQVVREFQEENFKTVYCRYADQYGEEFLATLAQESDVSEALKEPFVTFISFPNFKFSENSRFMENHLTLIPEEYRSKCVELREKYLSARVEILSNEQRYEECVAYIKTKLPAAVEYQTMHMGSWIMAREKNEALPNISQSQVDEVVSSYEAFQNAKAMIPAVDEEWQTFVNTTVLVSIVEE
ncbi:MAG: hypothetical protein K1000chlam4_00238 [Chlamydiae bacterium]|nr:hypothetical protein [Chlamydiota bacterium]